MGGQDGDRGNERRQAMSEHLDSEVSREVCVGAVTGGVGFGT